MSALQETARIVSGHMDEIKTLFKPEVRITIIVRSVKHDSRDFLMTDDDLEQVEKLLERRKAAGMDKPL